MTLGEADQVTYEYDEQTDQTKVTWYATLENRTIYNFFEFKIEFELYNATDTEPVALETFYYDTAVRHGGRHSGHYEFTVDGEITRIERTRWAPHYETLWKTYRAWFIVAIIAVLVCLFFYTVFVFVIDFTLEDVIDTLEELLYIPILLATCFGGTALWGLLSSNWVNVCIVAGALVTFAFLAVIAHFVRYILRDVLGIFDIPHAVLKRRKAEDTYDYDEDEDEDEDEDDDDRSEIKISFENGSENGNENESKRSRKKANPPRSGIRFSDIAGLEEAKTAFYDKIILPFEHKELFEKYGKKVGGGLLLYGLPGTGKTLFAEACANELDALFIPIKCSDIKSKWYGESEGNVKKIFAKARKAERAIIFFDEFEAIGAKRTDNPDNSNNDLVPQILAEMQGVGSSNSSSVVMVIAATNKPWAIDSAFLRPGRFDEKIYIPLPDAAARAKMFELKLRGVPTDTLDYEKMAALTEGYNGADITEFCEKLKLDAIKKTVTSGSEHLITMEEVMSVRERTHSSVSQEDLEQLREFERSV